MRGRFTASPIGRRLLLDPDDDTGTALAAIAAHADEATEIRSSGVTVRHHVVGARHVAMSSEGEYASALGDGSLFRFEIAHGVEDFVTFDRPPEREELAYDVDVDGVAGLRLVANTLEFLDADGVPRLRVNPPRVEQRALDELPGPGALATLEVAGCAYSTDPRPPWRVPVTPPGARTCRMTVRWSHVGYPLIVDPSWTDTRSLNVPRFDFALVDVPSDGGANEVFAFGGATDDGGVLDSIEYLYVDDAGARGAWSPSAEDAGLAHPRRSHAALAYLTKGADGGTARKILVAGGSCCQADAGCSCTSCCPEEAGCPDCSQTTTEIYDIDDARLDDPPDAFSEPYPQPTLTRVRGGLVLLGSPTLRHGEQFDGGAWTATADVLSTARALGSATAVHDGGEVLACGGIGDASTSCDLFDLDAGLAATIPLQHAHFGHAASYYEPNDDVAIAAGSTYDDAGSVVTTGRTERVRLRAQPSSRDSDLIGPTKDFAAATRADGVVTLTGGIADGVVLPSAWAYEPKRGTWLQISSTHARHGHAQALTPAGVLAAGGVSQAGDALTYTNIFAPVLNGQFCLSELECVNLHCSDNVCCDRACGNCESCLHEETDAATGTCAPVLRGFDPKETCRACGAVCDGDGGCEFCDGGDGATCVLRNETGTCGDAACDPKTGTISFSDCTDGTCGARSCSPHNCRTDTTPPSCFKGGCTTDEQCAPRFKCRSTGCVPPCTSNFDCDPGTECGVDGYCAQSLPVRGLDVSCAAAPGVARASAACASIALALLGLGAHLRRRQRRG
ncbi:MAG TPA: hypothetical protein VGM56_19215 [Byssovorax sp.]